MTWHIELIGALVCASGLAVGFAVRAWLDRLFSFGDDGNRQRGPKP